MAAANQRAPVELLSTHPSGPTRISDIQANLPKVEGLYARAAKPARAVRAAAARADARGGATAARRDRVVRRRAVRREPAARSASRAWRRSTPLTGGSTATWRTSARMLSAPVLARMLPIWLRTVEIATPSSAGDLRRRHAVAQLHQDPRLGAGEAVAAGEALHRQRLAHLALAEDDEDRARAGVGGFERDDRDAGCDALSSPRVSEPAHAARRRPPSRPRGAARRRAPGGRAARCRRSCSGWQIVELDLGGVVDVDDAHAVEKHDDAVVELVERGGEPVADRRRRASARARRRADGLVQEATCREGFGSRERFTWRCLSGCRCERSSHGPRLRSRRPAWEVKKACAAVCNIHIRAHNRVVRSAAVHPRRPRRSPAARDRRRRAGVRRYPAQAILINEGDSSRLALHPAERPGQGLLDQPRRQGSRHHHPRRGRVHRRARARRRRAQRLGDDARADDVLGRQRRAACASSSPPTPTSPRTSIRKLIRSRAPGDRERQEPRARGRLRPRRPPPRPTCPIPAPTAQRRVRERLTQQGIADRVGASREMVSRIFKDLGDGRLHRPATTAGSSSSRSCRPAW